MNKTSIPNVIWRVAGGGRSFFIKLGRVFHRYRDIVRDLERPKSETVLKLTEGKKLVLCVALGRKRKCDFFFYSRHIRKIN